MPNQTIRTQLEHRSIRAFRPEPVGDEVISTVLDAVDRAATSSFYQQRTVIRVLDPEVRAAVYAASGQPYVGGDRGELFVFVVDLYRNAKIRKEAGVDNGVMSSTALFLQGVEDVLIGAQNMVVAAESLGLGTVYLGSIGGDPQSVITALKLPLYTFPLVGLLVGHADQEPTLKPRLPREFTYAVDHYPQVGDYHQALAGYDQIVKTYYDLRDASKPVDTFTRQIETKPGSGRAEKAPVRAALTAQKLALY